MFEPVMTLGNNDKIRITRNKDGVGFMSNHPLRVAVYLRRIPTLVEDFLIKSERWISKVPIRILYQKEVNGFHPPSSKKGTGLTRNRLIRVGFGQELVLDGKLKPLTY